MKKLICVMLVVLLLASLTACSCSSSETNYENDPVPGWDNSVSEYSPESVDPIEGDPVPESNNGAYTNNGQESVPSSVSAGDIVVFGSYEQDNDLNNGKEPIEWIVLDRSGDRALVISKYALDCQLFDSTMEYGYNFTWETCSLRKWLNGTFLQNAFNSAEQSSILNSDAGRVFILTVSEAESLFASDDARKCAPTAYAQAQGAFVTEEEKTGTIVWTEAGYTCWWLRSPDNNKWAGVAFVDHNGWVADYQNNGYKGNAVRPAMWITLGASAASNPQQQTEVTTPAQTNESAGDQVVTFKDAAFEKAFRENYGFTGTIYESDILAVTELNLDNCGLTDISDVALFKNLTELSLRWNAIEDISVLQGLTELSSVYLYDNKIDNQGITVLSGLTNLTYLNVGFNQISDISALRSLTNLTYLYLSGNQISDISALAGLTNLTELLLEVNPLGDISALKGLTNLKELYLNNCGLTEAQINELKALLPGCEIFS